MATPYRYGRQRGASVTFAATVGVGGCSAVCRHAIGDYPFTFLGFSGLAVPDFLLGLVLMYVAFACSGHTVRGIFSGDYVRRTLERGHGRRHAGGWEEEPFKLGIRKRRRTRL